mgnify:CR=1 FL=1
MEEEGGETAGLGAMSCLKKCSAKLLLVIAAALYFLFGLGMAIGFGSKLVGPFYQAIAALQPDVQPCVDMLNDNVDVWTKMDA